MEFIKRSQRLGSQGCSGAAFIKGTALILSLDEPKIYCSCYLTLESSTYSSLNFNRTTDLFPILFFNPFPRIDPTRALPPRRCRKQLVAERARVWISACAPCHAALPSLPAAGASLPGLSRKQDGLALRHIPICGCLPHLAAQNTQIKRGLSQTWPILLKKSSMESPEARPCFWSKGEAHLVCHTGMEEPLCLAVKAVTAQGTSLRDNLSSVQIQAIGVREGIHPSLILFSSVKCNSTGSPKQTDFFQNLLHVTQPHEGGSLPRCHGTLSLKRKRIVNYAI